MDSKILTLADIQAKIKAPKKNRNNFGKFNYRSVEDIYEAVKPVLEEAKATLSMSDEIRFVDGRFYLVASATVTTADGKTFTAQGWARESDSKTGMDAAQLTGACSSYARKYALCGLFLIDGSDDFDAMDNRTESAPQATQKGKADSRRDGFLKAMEGLMARNKKVAVQALGNLGFERAEDVPADKIEEVYRAVKTAFDA